MAPTTPPTMYMTSPTHGLLLKITHTPKTAMAKQAYAQSLIAFIAISLTFFDDVYRTRLRHEVARVSLILLARRLVAVRWRAVAQHLRHGVQKFGSVAPGRNGRRRRSTAGANHRVFRQQIQMESTQTDRAMVIRGIRAERQYFGSFE
jgi:hypothetical protein